MSNKYPIISGIFFGVIAVFQAVRALSQWPVHIGTFEVPIWFSWIAMFVAGGFCIWAFRSRRK